MLNSIKLLHNLKFKSLVATVSALGSQNWCQYCGQTSYSTNGQSKSPDFQKVLADDAYKEDDSIIMGKPLKEEELIERYRNLKALNVVDYDTSESLLLLGKHPFTIRNRMEFLREVGIRDDMITSRRLSKFLLLIKLNISTLKNCGLIPENLDVMSHLLQYVDLEPQYYPEQMLDSTMTISTLRHAVLLAFLKRRFDVDGDDITKKSHITRLSKKSFTTINRNIQLLKKDVGMTNKSLRLNLYLLASNPANIEMILRDIKEVGNIDIRIALRTRPKIMCNTLFNLHKILAIIKEYQIPRVIHPCTLKLFTLSADTVKSRLEEMKNLEYFQINLEHPRLADLLLDHRQVKKRLTILEKHSMNQFSISSILSHNRFWKLVMGFQRSRSQDIIYFMSHQYGGDSNQWRATLKAHPYWSCTSLVSVSRNNTFLSKHLSKEDISKCIYVLFYPCDKVQEEFFKLNSREGLEMCKDNGQVRPELVTQLITYFIEKEVNFSMQGMFLTESTESEAIDAPHDINMSAYNS